jgi:hypothetical protein
MDEYYALKYKSSPENIAYILHKEGRRLDLVGSKLSPRKMGIKLNDKGEIALPKYFCPLRKVDETFVSKTISDKMDSKIERVVNSL